MAGMSSAINAAIAVTRFGLGAKPGEIADASTDPRGWLLGQIHREGASQPLTLGGLPFPDSQTRFTDFITYRAAIKEAGDDEMKRKAAREALRLPTAAEMLCRTQLATATGQPFTERWTLFWSNHFTVSVNKSQELAALAPTFEREAIRPHVFGRFEDLLVASSRHPAMLMYLDQAQSIGPNSRAGLRKVGGLNENLAREIMELHTLGADAGYTQGDVTEFARALTGWSVGRPNQAAEYEGAYLYRPNVHEPGSRQIFGRRYGDGEEDQARRVLADLAASPKTADHLARKIAIHFVSDQPDPALVSRLSEAYRRSNGDLARVAEALITAPEAWREDAAKIKTPYELLVSGYRAVGQQPRDFAREVNNPLSVMGQRPLSAPQPNGWSESGAEWAAPDALIKRLQWAQGFANVYTPQDDPAALAASALGARLGPATLTAIQRAESRKEALAILIMSPEFQRR